MYLIHQGYNSVLTYDYDLHLSKDVYRISLLISVYSRILYYSIPMSVDYAAWSVLCIPWVQGSWQYFDHICFHEYNSFKQNFSFCTWERMLTWKLHTFIECEGSGYGKLSLCPFKLF